MRPHLGNALKLLGGANDPLGAIRVNNLGLIALRRNHLVEASADFTAARMSFERSYPAKDFPDGQLDLIIALDHEGEAV